LAYVGGVCSPFRYSLFEDFGSFTAIHILAHELGHNLGSKHDGTIGVESCPESDNYIMAPFVPGSSSFQNSVYFSNCSKEQIKSFLLNKNGTASNVSQCLLNKPSFDGELSFELPPNRQLPGQSFTPDDQCKQQFGDLSSYCPERTYNICELMYCRVNNTSDYSQCLRSDGAADGTFCNSKQVIHC
jgi:hypothetical protein